MHLNIQGRHLAVTPALNQYVKAKIKKIKYYFDHIVHAHVVLEVVKIEQIAEATITVEHHHFHNRVSSDDMYKSIDMLFDKLEIQVRRYKEHWKTNDKKVSKRRNHLNEMQEIDEKGAMTLEDIEIEDKPMSELEAVLQLSLDKNTRFLGFTSPNTSVSNFLIKHSPEEYELITFDDHWERKHIKKSGDQELEINSVQNVKFSTESIENAVDFIEHNQTDYRLFKSVRSDSYMFLFKKKLGHFGLIREHVS